MGAKPNEMTGPAGQQASRIAAGGGRLQPVSGARPKLAAIGVALALVVMVGLGLFYKDPGMAVAPPPSSSLSVARSPSPGRTPVSTAAAALAASPIAPIPTGATDSPPVTSTATPSPQGGPRSTQNFSVPFSLDVPALDMILFRKDDPLRYELSNSPHLGLGVYALEKPAIYPCPHGIGAARRIRAKPLGLLADLQQVGKMKVRAEATELDGRKGWLLNVSGSTRFHCDAILALRPTPSSPVVDLARAQAQTWLIRTGATTVLVQVWGDPGEWDRWGPIALQMVESIHFLDQ